MLRGLYSAATGVDAAMISHEVTAENLAHSNVPGYRRRGIAFSTFEQALTQAQASTVPSTQLTGGPAEPFAPGQPFSLGQLPPTAAATTTGNATDSLLGTQVSFTFTDFEGGPLQQTNNPLDVAATGDVFFVVDGPNGPQLTRNGTFRLGLGSQLQNASGFNVRGEGGAITIPPDTAQIIINQEGLVLADGNQVGRLQLAVVPPAQAQGMVKSGTTLFQGPIPRAAPEPGTVRIEQGFREQSNVQPVLEMVNLLSALRYLQANDRALSSLSEAVALATRPQG